MIQETGLIERVAADERFTASVESCAELKLINRDEPFEEQYDALIRSGVITEVDLAKLLACDFHLEFDDQLALRNIHPADFNLVPKDIALRHTILPLGRQGDKLVVAFFDPTNIFARDDLKFLTGMNCQVVIAPKSHIKTEINQRYGPSNDEATGDWYEDACEDAGEHERALREEEIDIEELEGHSQGSAVVRLVNNILGDAVRRGASEIHIEPYEKEFDVRYRVDGRLQTVFKPPLRLKNAIVSRLKVMSELDIAQRRKIQSGKLRLVLGAKKEALFDVSVLPVLNGEKVVLKIRDVGVRTFLPDDFLFNADEMGELQSRFSRPGMKVIFGPAMSGKSAMLSLIAQEMHEAWEGQNVVAIGDVGSSDFAGLNVNFVCVQEKFLSAAEAMVEACSRQSADVIIFDHLPDAATLKAALNGVLAGKVVIMQIAASSAEEAREMLSDLLDHDKRLNMALNLLVGTRLARRLCSHCRVEMPPDARMIPAGMGKAFMAACCAMCHGGGHRGQVGFGQLLRADGTPLGEIMAAKMKRAVETGLVTPEELIRLGLLVLE